MKCERNQKDTRQAFEREGIRFRVKEPQAMHGEQGILRWAKEWKADAIIGQWNNDTIDLQKELNIPVVLQNYHHRSVTYSNLTGDYKGTGRMAAQFFAKRMFRNFAYFGVKGVVWSDERCEGYRQEVKRIGGEFFSFESDKQEDEIRMEVSQWLQQLPKPVALFCCDDAHALFISETCKMTNIPIPEEIALLGVGEITGILQQGEHWEENSHGRQHHRHYPF